MAETLAAGDLTTAFSKWLAGVAGSKHETLKARLNTNYGTTNADIQPLLAKFLKNRA